MEDMESEFDSEKIKNKVDSCLETSFLQKNGNVEAEPSKVIDGRISLGPITPNPDRENNGKDVLDFLSPLTWVSSTTGVCSDSGRIDEAQDLCSSPRTPREDVFDPFAPGPDEMMFAPLVKKYMKEARNNVSRRLDFDSSMGFKEHSNDNDGVVVLSQEEILLDTIYESFLDAIISKQVEGVAAEILSKEIGVSGGFKTPTKFPLLNGIAESCPGAPKKPRPSSRNIDPTMCKKLEF